MSFIAKNIKIKWWLLILISLLLGSLVVFFEVLLIK